MKEGRGAGEQATKAFFEAGRRKHKHDKPTQLNIPAWRTPFHSPSSPPSYCTTRTLSPAKTAPIACLWPASPCSPRSNTTSTINRRDIMGQAQEDMATAIFDITHQSLVSFDRVVAKHDESILTRSFVPGDAVTTSNSQKRSSCDFLGLRNSFLFWIDYTGALSLMNSSLDARLRGLADISAMVIELLEMILRNLHRGEFNFINPSTIYLNFLQMDRLRIS